MKYAVSEGQGHLIHPLHSDAEHRDAIIFEEAEGLVLRDVNGRRYVDGFSGLWNVLVGYGRRELAEVAAGQMQRLAYCTAYSGYSNVAAVQLAERLAGLAHPTLNTSFFTSGGAEANESAFKTARWFWKWKGRPEKTTIISRWLGYHGVTMAAMAATGMPNYWPMFEPRVPGFVHVPPPYPFRMDGRLYGESVGETAVRLLEDKIVSEGPETVAAIIAEPVMGGGGVIVPPDDYFPKVRALCDKYDILLIADEIITGFGRTGRMFGLQNWGVRADIVTFGKGVTSGYVPLSGMLVSDEIGEAICYATAEQKWMHAFTYSAHPTCCAVALANLNLIEAEGLVQRAARLGAYFLDQLQALYEFGCVGEVRGLGLMVGIEFVEDHGTKKPAVLGEAVRQAAQAKGLICRARPNVLMLAPSLTATEADLDWIATTVADAIRTVTAH